MTDIDEDFRHFKSDYGYIRLHRDTLVHKLFEHEVFNEFQAWVWLIAAAAWRPISVRPGRRGRSIELKRGQLAFARRFLAQRWRWHESKVRRFLERLQTEAMITLKTDHQSTRITICNYNKYQTDGSETDHEPTINRPKEEEVKKERSNSSLFSDDELPTKKRPVDDNWPSDHA